MAERQNESMNLFPLQTWRSVMMMSLCVGRATRAFRMPTCVMDCVTVMTGRMSWETNVMSV